MLIQKVLKSNWILLIGGSLLITMKAEASCHIHPTDGDVAKVRSAASASGALYQNSVCGLAITRRDGHRMAASGFLVSKPVEGPAKIVTAAHDFYDQDRLRWEDIASVKVTFREEIDFFSPIIASRIDIRDGFHMDPAGGNCRHDVAAIEVPRDLIPAECVPLEFYTGIGYKKPLIEALHVGYCQFSTTSTPYDHGLTKRYGGYTSVTYTSLWDNLYFTTYLVSRYKTPADMIARPECVEHFNPSLAAEIHRDRGPTKASREELIQQGFIYLCEPHKKQSLMGPGGSGGPLLFNTKGGPKVAGICSRTAVLPEHIRLPEDQFVLAACYEPVMSHADWILSNDPAKPVTKRYVF